MKADTQFGSYLVQFFSECEVFRTKFVGKIRTHILCSVTLSENLAVYEIMWGNILERGQAKGVYIIRLMCVESWVTGATDTQSEYVILIVCPR